MTTESGEPLKPITMNEVRRVAPLYGADTEERIVKLWTVANMMKSDHGESGRKYGGDAMEYYLSLAKEWLNDDDAVEDKLEKYKMCIVQR